MIVTFVSQCEKKSLAKTRRVLDAYANRIGDNVWQTIITEEGLLMVKKLLRKTTTKNTAVSCHWIRSRRRSDLLWIVGNRQKFNSEGIVPVNRTEKKLIVKDMEDDWRYLPIIKALTAISALLHDWGKCSDLFQEKLIKQADKFKGDPIRHEWISCLLLQSLVVSSKDLITDKGWLHLLSTNQWDEKKLIKEMQRLLKEDEFKQLQSLPPFAQMVSWIIVSHHRIPDLKLENYENGVDGFDDYSDVALEDLSELFETIKVTWNYENNFDGDFKKRLPKCFKFSSGLLKESTEWIKGLKRWSSRLLDCIDQVDEIIDNHAWRAIIQYSRLSLMLGDHHFSSLPKNDKLWQPKSSLMANTDKKTKDVKQYLDEHLCGVYNHALHASQYLKNLTFEMPFAHDLKKIKAKSPSRFIWQDLAVKEIQNFRKQESFNLEQGWFIVNMASTGTGKTIANAKIMQALSEDGDALRYILALGLRTLTLQTGDSYRENLGMEKEDLAVLIGSKVVQELHEDAKKQHSEEEISYEEIGSESLEALLDDGIDYTEGLFYPEFMNVLFSQKESIQAEKNKAFLYQPILVCTIDHIMGATETTRGGKYLLPYLRLLSSDLVIDEVDDFGVEDLIPLARLVHLAGMLGRKVMISSATIPPSLSEGLFNAYQKGFTVFTQFRNLPNPVINAMWVDEFKSIIEPIKLPSEGSLDTSTYQKSHDTYVKYRVDCLLKQLVKQKAKIINCEHLRSEKEDYYNETLQKQYFELIKENIETLHMNHHTIDKITGKKVSFGVVRVANIPPCVALTRYLLNADWSHNVMPRIMAYHSRQVLLLRSIQEQHLDTVLSRKEAQGLIPKALQDPIIRAHIDQSDQENIIFVLVATPVEEVGRDHDFDWAVIEPSSYRSIIQLSGRVLRHRQIEHDVIEPNIALMQFNLKGIYGRKVAFNRPGFESSSKRFQLSTKNISELIDHKNGQFVVNAIPRIQMRDQLNSHNNLADLEHARIQFYLMNEDNQGAKSLNGWLNGAWFLTGLPQRFYRFRKSAPDIQLFAVHEEDEISFCEKNDDGHLISRNELYDIQKISLSDEEMTRLWFNRDYYEALYDRIESKLDVDNDEPTLITRASKRYGEIMIPETKNTKSYLYSDQLGMFIENI